MMMSGNNEYVTVVTVDNDNNESSNNCNSKLKEAENSLASPSSPFVMVLSINDTTTPDTEAVIIHKKPAERLGFGLKFLGGAKSNENIQKLFIQSCAEGSPAARAKASWGYLKEGDEIVEIAGVPTCCLTRLECVERLKEDHSHLKLVIRQGNGKFIDSELVHVKTKNNKKPAPPPPPPVPPRKLCRRKSVELPPSSSSGRDMIDVRQPQPPEAEIYTNILLDDQRSLLSSESDADSASTLSTVIDKFSLCSSMSMSSISEAEYESTTDLESLAKVLKPFQLLEQEFNLDPNPVSKLGMSGDYVDMSSKNRALYEVMHFPGTNNREKNKSIRKDYENVEIKSITSARSTVYENVDIKSPPKPKPRQVLHTSQPNNKTNSIGVVPLPRVKSTDSKNITQEFSTIQTWLQDATELVHDCPMTETETEFEYDKSSDNRLFENLELEEGEKIPFELINENGPSQVHFSKIWSSQESNQIGKDEANVSTLYQKNE